MSRRKLLPIVVLPVVILLLGALATAPGNAELVKDGWPGALATASGNAELVKDGWPGVPVCAEGTLAAGERTTTDPVRTPLVVSVQPCAGADPATVARARWGLALYFDSGAYVGEGADHPFDIEAPATRTTTGFPDGGLMVGILGEIRAACAITRPAERVACVRVDATGAAGTIVVQPLPIDDPLVTRTVTILRAQQPDPGCAACV